MNDMLFAILGSASVSSVITFLSTKGKTKAETAKLIAESYGEALENLRSQIKFQGDLIASQAQQMTAMQEKEKELLKIIGQHHEEKKALIDKHSKIEEELKGKIKDLEIKLAYRMEKLENKFQ